VWEGQDTVPAKALAATTNGTLGNQTFGITSGTLGCEAPTKRAKNDGLNEFVVANMDSLAMDIAKGQGETLDTFAELMQVPAQDRLAFNQKLQSNFAVIFPSENVVLADVVDSVITVASN
jgi:hypothetical protein